MPNDGKQQRPLIFHTGVSHEEDSPVLSVTDLTVHYQGKPALEAVSFQLTRGERVAVVGPNGAGKSTLFKAIAGLLPLSEGQVQVYGHAPGGHICIAYVPQRSQIDWSFPVNVFDVVLMGRTSKIGLFRWPGRHDKRIVRECLELVGMGHLAGRQIGELSGGQQQRVFIARALAQEAQLMLMDEPLTGLDVTSQNDILTMLDTLRERQVTLLVATHDLNQAAEQFDRVLLLNQRLFGFGIARDILTMENLTAVYGGHLRVLEGTGAIVMADTCCTGGSKDG